MKLGVVPPLYILGKTYLDIKPHHLPWFWDGTQVTGTLLNLPDAMWLTSGMAHLPNIFLVAV